MNVEDLRNMSEEELIRGHDSDMHNRVPHYNVNLDGLTQRETLRQGERTEKLIRSINAHTIVITIATLLGVVLAGCGLLSG